MYPKPQRSVRNKCKSFGIFFCNILLWTIPHCSCSLLLSFSLIGLSLFTWHCPSRHRTPSQRSHLPNRHIHSLQKCQADKVSNPMPFLKDVCFSFLFSCLKTCQVYVKRALCFGAAVVYPTSLQVQILQRHTEKIIHPKLLVLEAVYENIMFRKWDF